MVPDGVDPGAPVPSPAGGGTVTDRVPGTAHGAAHGAHHAHLELPSLDLHTGEVPIPADERVEIEAEAPTIARPVEDIAEDRSWLSHRLLNFRTIFSFVLAIAIILFIFTRLDIDWGQTWQTISGANPALFFTGFVVYYSAFWVRAARWKMLLRNVGVDREKVESVSTNGLVEIIYLSWFVNSIVPAKLGDAYRSYLLKRNSGISFSSTIGTILAERVVDLLVLFGLLVASFMLVGRRLAESHDFPMESVIVMGGLMVLALLAGLVALRFFGHVILRFVPHRFKEMFSRLQHGVLRSFKRRALPALAGYTVVIWLIESGRLYFVTLSLNANVALSAVIFIALLSSLITTIPATPGGAGLVEGGVTFALSFFLKDQHLAFSIAILDRVINYWSLIVGGLVLYLLSRRKT